MPNKTYGQLCGIARALDVLGDRWTMLLIRELLLGPKRFKDLSAVLPAMGANRLSERLALLSGSGVIRHTKLTAPAALAYELTEVGERLRKPLNALGMWGIQLPMDERIEPSSARADLIALVLAGASDPKLSAGLHETYEFHVGAEVFHVRVSDGEVLARSGPSAQPADVQVHCDMKTFMALGLRELTPASALREGRATVERGGQRALTRVFKVLEFRP